MREPFRSAFIAQVRDGAASRDIHDSEARGEYDSDATTPADDRFLARELARVDTHARSLGGPLAARLGRVGAVLDVGCGTGGSTVALALSPLQPALTVGIDANARAVHAARLRAQGHGLEAGRVAFKHVVAGSQLPFDDASFDLVTCVSVLEFVGSPAARKALIGEMLRVARPSGHLYLATPNPFRLRELHSHRVLGDWRRTAGFPWASTRRALRTMCDGCKVESMGADRIRTHPRLRSIAWSAPLLQGALPWQRLLVRKDAHAGGP